MRGLVRGLQLTFGMFLSIHEGVVCYTYFACDLHLFYVRVTVSIVVSLEMPSTNLRRVIPVVCRNIGIYI